MQLEKKREKIFVEKIFGVCYIFRGSRKRAEKQEDLRKHGHSNLKAPPNEPRAKGKLLVKKPISCKLQAIS